MNEKTTEQKSPVYILTEALAAMTIRAETAERERDAARKDSNNWFDIFQKRDAEIKELEGKLASLRIREEELEGDLSAEIEEHRKTRSALEEAQKNMRKMKKER